MNKLNAKALGLAMGILWGASVLLMGLMSLFCSWSLAFVEFMAPMYVGYDATILGALIGTLWAFVDAFVGGWLLAWLYNKLAG